MRNDSSEHHHYAHGLEFSLVSYGYSMKDPQEDRRIALTNACAEQGHESVDSRLKFLHQAWIGTPKFVAAIEDDMQFVQSLQNPIKANNTEAAYMFSI
mmetsp:Transcript_75571/g.202356  ORF Transcript_75571/g.202356 Transcript_75571/m.202356 type:complete len:98 (-) Transcript_75571:219-512(-)